MIIPEDRKNDTGGRSHFKGGMRRGGTLAEAQRERKGNTRAIYVHSGRVGYRRREEGGRGSHSRS